MKLKSLVRLRSLLIALPVAVAVFLLYQIYFYGITAFAIKCIALWRGNLADVARMCNSFGTKCVIIIRERESKPFDYATYYKIMYGEHQIISFISGAIMALPRDLAFVARWTGENSLLIVGNVEPNLNNITWPKDLHVTIKYGNIEYLNDADNFPDYDAEKLFRNY